jgi:hypothetical protein
MGADLIMVTLSSCQMLRFNCLLSPDSRNAFKRGNAGGHIFDVRWGAK